ncbi:MAG: hypothetical protein ABSD45_03970 [Terriglobia bacterium]|jgi:hypothetical protein
MSKPILLSILMGCMLGTSAAQGPVVRAYLFNPSVNSIVLKYPYEAPPATIPVRPSLTLTGRDLSNGSYDLVVRLEARGQSLHEEKAGIRVENGWFEKGFELQQPYPAAETVSWELSAPNQPRLAGHATLKWSRFSGRVKYLSGKPHPTYINLIPVTWESPGKIYGEIYVPVADDGTFDAKVPSRVYGVVNVNGAGYGFDSLERWAWDYDLTRDREETFTIGRIELYGMHAFHINGGPPTVFVTFRPTALTRVLKFHADRNGILNESEMKSLQAALKDSPTVIGPELRAENVKVWFDGQPLPILRFDMIPEAQGDGTWQVDYILQVAPHVDREHSRGVWHEIKLEVSSQEELRGTKITDWGEGSVGFFRP